mmetsp:Transcript_2265/g.7143  ORF Transcript_2265/g.7143 Transcript_2265/m.7143 type:complete len:236 (-) Transcript_2265:42-749(-)
MAGLISRDCSKNKWCRREGKNWPNILELDKYTNSFSGRHRAAKWKISESEDFGHATGRAWNQDVVEGRTDHLFPRSFSAAGSLGPGQYRVHRHFPTGKDEFRHWAPRGHTFAVEPRVAKDGALKGNSPMVGKLLNPLGPGQYPTTEMDVWKHAPKRQPFLGCDRSQEDERFLRRAKSMPGPGYYEAADTKAFEEASKRWDEAARKKCRGCHWETQFSHIFSTFKPHRGPKTSAAA